MATTRLVILNACLLLQPRQRILLVPAPGAAGLLINLPFYRHSCRRYAELYTKKRNTGIIKPFTESRRREFPFTSGVPPMNAVGCTRTRNVLTQTCYENTEVEI